MDESGELRRSSRGVGRVGGLDRPLQGLISLEWPRVGRGVAAASLPDWHFVYLLQGEIVFQNGFAWCLIERTYALTDRRRRTELFPVIETTLSYFATISRIWQLSG